MKSKLPATANVAEVKTAVRTREKIVFSIKAPMSSGAALSDASSRPCSPLDPIHGVLVARPERARQVVEHLAQQRRLAPISAATSLSAANGSRPAFPSASSPHCFARPSSAAASGSTASWNASAACAASSQSSGR